MYMGTDLVFGKNPVQEAMKGKRQIYEIFLDKEMNTQFKNYIGKWAKQRSIPYQQVSADKLEQFAGNSGHQGILAKIEPFKYNTLTEVLDNHLAKSDRDVVDSGLTLLILDHLTDPQNFGAILRTADAAGVQGVIIPNRRSVDITPTVAKASSGACEHVPVIKVANLRQTIRKLKEQWIWVVGTDAESQSTIYEEDLNIPLAVVMGSEGQGISQSVLKECDILTNIPMDGAVNSLNVSVATALILYEAYRQKRC